MTRSPRSDPHDSTIVHIGMFKTGTTALQRHVFPKITGCNFVTRGTTGEDYLFRILSNELCRADDEQYLGATFRSFLNDLSRRTSTTLLLSNEGFSGDPFEAMRNVARNAVRLRSLVPGARILLVVREQAAMIRSLYSYYVLKGGYASFAEFVDNRAPGCEFSVDGFHYDGIVRLYQELFGADRVTVLAYELMLDDEKRFLTELTSFIGASSTEDLSLRASENRALSPPSRWLLRQSNRLFRSSRFNPRPQIVELRAANRLRRAFQNMIDPRLFTALHRQLSPREETMLAELRHDYRGSNADLAEMTSLPLRSFGYALPTKDVMDHGRGDPVDVGGTT